MTALISHRTIDLKNTYESPEWWKQTQGYANVEDNSENPDDEKRKMLSQAGVHHLLCVEVDEFDVTTPELSLLDLRPSERTGKQELETLLSLDAMEVEAHRRIQGPDTGWVVLADPEGNQLCIPRARHKYSSGD